ncbi:hypothetical protein WJX77_007480 [Trebouxia sp. C0004]
MSHGGETRVSAESNSFCCGTGGELQLLLAKEKALEQVREKDLLQQRAAADIPNARRLPSSYAARQKKLPSASGMNFPLW